MTGLLEGGTRAQARNIAVLFDEVANVQAARRAVVSGDTSITYRTLKERADQLAAHLTGLGVVPETFVGCAIERSIDLIVALVAIVKAGGAYVPLDPAYPDDRLSFMIDDSRCPVVIADKASAERLGRLGVKPTIIDVAGNVAHGSGRQAVASANASPLKIEPATAAYVMYTSGSTGRPRGVVVEHQSIIRLVRDTDYCQFGPDEVWLQAAPLAFDASTLEIWGALLNGGCIVAAPQRASLEDLGQLIAREGVTSAWFTSGLFNLMVEQRLEDLRGLRQLLAGGDVLSPRHVRMALDGLPGCTLINGYGPTENTTFTCCHAMRRSADVPDPVPIGRAIGGSTVYILDEALQPVADGELGELYTGGLGVARGYLNDPQTTAQRFLADPFAGTPGARMYKTSDLVRRNPDGSIRFIGRADSQIKILGHRIEPGEIETVLLAHPAVKTGCVVVDRDDKTGTKRLLAYYVNEGDIGPAAIRTYLADKLPRYMLPALIVPMCAMPLTHNGKIDRSALPRPKIGSPSAPAPARSNRDYADAIRALWRRHLGVESVGLDDNFFDIGGDSLKLVALHVDLERDIGRDIGIIDLFEFTTPRSLARQLASSGVDGSARGPAPDQRSVEEKRPNIPDVPAGAIAVIGMAGRFPGADNVAELWRNQLAGVESIAKFTTEELEIADAAAVADNPGYVRSRSILKDVEMFDADFFGIMAREAAVMDPQQRLFMEVCHEALEDAGYDPIRSEAAIGVFGGASVQTYLLSRLCRQDGFLDRFTEDYQVGSFQELVGNGSDFFATRVAYKLNLQGPAITVQSACSTSLVAVAQACQALMTNQCDMALAGGVSISFPQKRGTHYLEGGMTSPDGHCRTFDANANGTVFGSGGAVVLLKRLDAALRDNDQIYGVIRGFGLSNDGNSKVGYTAPSAPGQSRAIRSALDMAGVSADSIGYLEAHGTGTPLGDPIEFSALNKVYRKDTQRIGYCAIGTIKTNIGHLDAAAGVTGLINAINVVRHGLLPPTLHFRAPNPTFDLASSPFRVNTTLSAWPGDTAAPRRAGVSAFGVGGTNCHVVIESAPRRAATSPERRETPHILPLSARSPEALLTMKQQLVRRLDADADLRLADVAHTLQSGRRRFATGAVIVASDRQGVLAALKGSAPERLQERSTGLNGANIAFLFPGQGSQYAGMARGLYGAQATFRKTLDDCCESARPLIGEDILPLLIAPEDAVDAAGARLKETRLAQPALFALEVALARQWIALGVLPQCMVGHSVGEFAAACVAGVFSLDDGLRMVAARGRLMQQVAPGSMLSVRLPADDVARLLTNSRLSIAARNAPDVTVVAGPQEEIEALAASLETRKIVRRRLVTSHAFHSAMMDPVLDDFRAIVGAIKLAPPTIPIISSVTGTELTAERACDPEYWVRHLRETVDFSSAVAPLRQDAKVVLLEVGAGNTLTSLALQHSGASQVVAASLPGPQSDEEPVETFMQSVGSLWLAGIDVDWSTLQQESGATAPRRISLPTYPFERKYYGVPAPKAEDRTSTLDAMQATVATTPAISAGATQFSSMELISMPSASATLTSIPAAASATSGRAGRIEARLRHLVRDLSGKDLAGVGDAVSFLEMGFDSLFLTQLTRDLKRELNLKITFRQLLDQQSTFAKLAQYADSVLPASAFADESKAQVAQPPAASATVAIVPTPPAVPTVRASMPAAPSAVQAVPQIVASSRSADSAIERVVRDQLQVMARLFETQIGALAGTPAASTTLHTLAATPPAADVQTVAAAPAVTSSAPPPVVAPQALAPVAGVGDGSKEFKAFGPYKPIQAKINTALSPKQLDNIKALTERYSRRHAHSKAETERYRKVLADPRVVSGFREEWKEMVFPINITRSKGSRLFDIDGNEFIDILNGFGPVMFGHRPEFVEQAVAQQLSEGFEIGPQTPLAGEVAALFCELTGNERATFCNTGSEAVMAAMRLARTVTARNKILMFTGDYHGMFDEVLVRAHRSAAGITGAAPIAPGIPNESVSNIVVLDYGTPETLEWIRANVGDLAAVIVEPVQSRRPSFRPIEFLREVRKLTADAGTALVFDEVVTGFRTHPGGCQALFGIRADMATYGKVAGGGMPIGILGGRAEFMDALDGGTWRFGDSSVPEVGVTFFAGTFVRHPLALAGTKAVLQTIKREGVALQERLGARTDNLVQRLNVVLERYAIPTRVSNFTSFFYFSFPPEERLASLFYSLLRLQGIHVLEGFPCFLTTEHGDADCDRIVAAFEAAAQEMRRAGFLFSEAPANLALPAAVPTPMPAAAERAAVAKQTVVPLTEPQREIFFAAMLGDDASTAFNESFTIHLDGTLDRAAMHKATAALVRRHDALRARVGQDGVSLIIDEERNIPLTEVDLSAQSATAADASFRDLLDVDARRAFDLHAGPLTRMCLVTLPQGKFAVVISAHHIVCDGWSVNVILEDLARLYSRAATGRDVALPNVLPFAAYAQRQAAARSGDDVARNEAYWLGLFKTIPAPLDLPTDRPRGATRTFAGTTRQQRIERDDYVAIKSMGGRNGVSLFATLLAGFGALIGRMAGSADVVVGIPMAGQQTVDDGVLVGHCVNFLPLRLPTRSDSRFKELMLSARDQVLDAHEHQDYTYGTLVEKLRVKRDPARLPLTELQFNVEQIGAATAFAGLEARIEPNPKAAVNSDLFLNIVEGADGLDLYCDYNTDLFDEATIDGWLTAYRALLVAAIAAPDANIAALPVPIARPLDASKRVRSVSAMDLEKFVRWNETTSSFPADQTIHGLFEAQARKTPDAIALVLGDSTLTYRELDGRANAVARLLHAKGVKPEQAVGLSVQRSFDLVAGVLGILKAGAAYVPVDPTLPRNRFDLILEDTAVRVILSTSRVVLPDTAIERINLDTIPRDDNASLAPLDARATPTSLAYIMFTSGSTGRPKGVMIEHRAVIRLVKGTNYCRFGADTAFLVNAPVSFDASTFELWGPLLNGGRAVLMPPGDPSLAELGRVIREQRVTTAFLTTGLFHVMVEQQLADLGILKQLFTGGEVLSPKHMQRVVDELPGTELYAVYGPTEGTTFTTFHPMLKGHAVPNSIPIGKPIGNARTYILDDDRRPLPIGEIGELYIAGDGLARGYLNNPEVTAQRFVDATIGGRKERLYRTGDHARFLDDGTLEFHGRVDGQIKLRGFRIEVGEIESAMTALPWVRQACVLPDQDQGRVNRLIAFCIVDESRTFDEQVLRHHLQERLPAYMAPSAIVAVPEFPLNANGKIDRAKLLAIEAARREKSVFTPPETPDEKTLASIVIEVMQIPRIGVTDNLFEIGVDSLRIFQIASRAAKAGLAITPRMVLETRNIRDIIANAAKAPAPSVTYVNIKPVARQRRQIETSISKG